MDKYLADTNFQQFFLVDGFPQLTPERGYQLHPPPGSYLMVTKLCLPPWAYLVVTKLCLPPLGLSRGYNIIPTHPWAYLVLSRSSSDPEFSMIA
jgi:hypothetical protein